MPRRLYPAVHTDDGETFAVDFPAAGGSSVEAAVADS